MTTAFVGFALLLLPVAAFSAEASAPVPAPAPLTAPVLSGKLGTPIELFNGKDLNGWKWFQGPKAGPHVEGVFEVKDGVIHSKGKPTGYLRSEMKFTDFVLLVEERHVTKGNGGLLVGIGDTDKIWPGLEIQTMTGHAGELWNHNLLKMTTDATHQDSTRTDKKHVLRTSDTQKPVGEWDTMEVIVDRGRLTFKVNGVVQSVVTDTESLAGRIGLQAEGAEMEFRKVQVTPIE